MTVRSTDALAVEIPEVVSNTLPRALWRNRWVVIVFLLLGLGAGLAIVFRSTPVFVSSSRLLFQQHAGSDEIVAPPAYVQAQANLIGSGQVLNDAAVTLGKIHAQTFSGSSDVYGKLRQNLSIHPGNGDGTVTVSYAGPVSSDNAVIVNTVVGAYRTYQSDHSKNSGQETLVALDHQKAQLNSDLTANERRLADFQSQNRILDASAVAGLPKQKLVRLNDQLIDSQSAVVTLNAKYDSLVAEYGAPTASDMKQPTTAPSAVMTESSIAAKPATGSEESEADPAWIQNELTLAQVNLDALKSRGMPDNNPGVVDARTSVEKFSRQLTASRRRSGMKVLTQVSSELDVAHRKSESFQSAFDAQNKAMTELDSKRNELTILQDAVARTRKQSDELDSQIQQSRTEQSPPMEIHLLEEARPAALPLSTGYRAIGIAGSAGLLLGLSIAFCLYATDHRLRSPAEVRSLLRLPVIGVLPRLSGTPSQAVCGLTSHTDPMSPLSEAARTVRSAIFFAGRSTSARTIVVTSSTRGEGSSTFASNLAITMAQAGSRTLLLDANFRNPTIPEIFEIIRPTGLSDILSGKVVLDRAITRTSIERLEVLTCGSAPRSPAELLNSGGFSRLIEQLTSRYQCVILDAPPVSTDADARILAASADLTIFVVRGGSTRRNIADQALEQLLSVGARVLGAVLNDVILRKPLQRSRGILRFVELSPGEQVANGNRPAQETTSFRTGQVSGDASAGMIKERMASKLVPEVEVVE